jgi:hypothetical protein
MVNGDESIIKNSGDNYRKGTTNFAQLGPPMDDLLLPDDEKDEALLLIYSLASETVSRDGVGVHWS